MARRRPVLAAVRAGQPAARRRRTRRRMQAAAPPLDAAELVDGALHALAADPRCCAANAAASGTCSSTTPSTWIRCSTPGSGCSARRPTSSCWPATRTRPCSPSAARKPSCSPTPTRAAPARSCSPPGTGCSPRSAMRCAGSPRGCRARACSATSTTRIRWPTGGSVRCGSGRPRPPRRPGSRISCGARTCSTRCRGRTWPCWCVRPTATLSVLHRALAAAGVPVAVTDDDLPLAAQTAVRPFLTLLRCADRPSVLDAEQAAVLLASPLGGADPLALRRLRRGLRRLERTAGGRPVQRRAAAARARGRRPADRVGRR